MDYRSLEHRLKDALGFQRRPVAVAFLDELPVGVPRFQGTMPSGCSFWRLAEAGRSFYTVPNDHYNCPIGSYTHNISLPEDRAPELDQTLSFMSEIGYLKMEEVPGIPRLPRTPRAVLYAPLGEVSTDPDVVIFAGRPGRLMLLQEATARAGVAAQFPALGRPTCMALPAAMSHSSVVSSGCIGNRIYTEVGDDELYLVVPGKDLPRVAEEAVTIVSANARLVEYHRQRKQALTSG
jgi:uncharacterized protein (DUF169 family)